MEGFEPTTTRFQSEDSDHTELHLVNLFNNVIPDPLRHWSKVLFCYAASSLNPLSPLTLLNWQGNGESNPDLQFWRLSYYHYTKPNLEQIEGIEPYSAWFGRPATPPECLPAILYLRHIVEGRQEMFYSLDAPLGFEPRLTGSKPVVLPLDEGAMADVLGYDPKTLLRPSWFSKPD